jgi:hypothetical protein
MAVASDARPRPPAGEARLLMDQGIEQFSRRLQANERPRGPAKEPSASPGRSEPPRRAEQADNEDAS